ncbi:MAG: lamin tail domain-containing protein [Chloroflexi bacterium]|nr:lamin tail domain-containing protein [Chloroflexota bacterium]MBT4074518.1 lamin tail domain-containing protein [Chloroflexota bacterium]MBT6680777.1 lamin tail domain-containing protein [Chloroflexota bacterium]
MEIVNSGSGTVDIAGWQLKDIADGTPTFQFPNISIAPGDSVRVYTNEFHLESGGLTFGRGTSIWNNSTPDEAGLFDLTGSLVSSKSYPPGC